MNLTFSIGAIVLIVELLFMMISLFFTPDRVPRWIWAVWLAVGIFLLFVRP